MDKTGDAVKYQMAFNSFSKVTMKLEMWTAKPFSALWRHTLYILAEGYTQSEDPRHTFQFSRRYYPLMLAALETPRTNWGSALKRWWRSRRNGRRRGKARKTLPWTLTSVPGSARILNTVSTWFLLHARWRRVSPLARTHNGQAYPKERRRKRREKPKIRVCLMSCPLSPSIWWTNQ